MAEAERVTDLVQEREHRSAAQRYVGIVRMLWIEMNVTIARIAGLAGRRELVQIEEPNLACLMVFSFLEADVGNVRPQVEHQLRHRLLLCCKCAEAPVLVT